MPPKAILIVDNCAAHECLQSDDGQIIVFPLPPNVTSVLQPMDQSPINVLKIKYRNQYLASIVAQENKTIEECVKEHTLRETTIYLKNAWNELPGSLIQNAWNKIRNWNDDDFDLEDNEPLSNYVTSVQNFEETLNEMQNLLNRIAPNCEMSLADIDLWNEDNNDGLAEDEYDTDGDDDVESILEGAAAVEPKISNLAALDFINGLIKYAEQNEAFGKVHLQNLYTQRSDVMNIQAKQPLKQNKIMTYFK